MRFLNIIQLRKISKLTMKLYASLQMIQVGFKRKLRVMQRFYETKKKKGGAPKVPNRIPSKERKRNNFLKDQNLPEVHAIPWKKD